MQKISGIYYSNITVDNGKLTLNDIIFYGSHR